MSTSTPLLDLLGVHWQLEAPVVSLAWSLRNDWLACALGDGHLAVTEAHWPSGPRVESRSGGGIALIAATAAAPALARIACHQGSCLSLAADAEGGFLSGGDDGRVVQLPRRGPPNTLSHTPGAWIHSLVCSRMGVRAHAIGTRVYCVAAQHGEAIDLPAPATALSFSSDGHRLAMAHSGGLTLWGPNGARRQLTWPGYHRAIAWSPNGCYIVTGMQENALHGWRMSDGGDIEMGGYLGQPLSLSFTHDGRDLVSSGGRRPVCWGFDPPGAVNQPVECALPSKTPVSCVSCHPKQPVIAVGYHNGAVLLCQPRCEAVLFVKGPGGGAVNAVAWSGDGRRLAFGTQEGLFGWLLVPDALFRTRPSAPAPAKEIHA